MKYSINDLYQLLQDNCKNNKFDSNLIIRTDDETIVLECINGQILGRIYRISEASLDANTVRQKLEEIWNEKTKNYIDQKLPQIAQDANNIRVSRERNDALNELLD